MSRTGQIQKVLGPEWSIKFVKANGDCFFAAICTALDDDDSTVQKLRDIVADACTEDTLEMMRLARAAGCANYEHLRRVDDLEGLKSRLRTNNNTEVITLLPTTSNCQSCRSRQLGRPCRQRDGS